ncbi:PREDICTED: uncharacterized protein LOC109486690 [Branchiostoma belcheri]|uniref:Uncharacterized protein LOC109486690 n=1 Tax=Branchiostoma belcheri TaxID=7741 RepID=A0A6P5AIP3_BRABE|nr:PREDICTED: uncharacterized protein LOC109486690 [Branchiostoma belcheri]
MAVLGSPLRRLTLVILLFCLFMGSTSWRRRRSGGCVCQLGVWGSWSTCSAPCGNSGEKTRYRTNYCCNGIEGASSQSQSSSCNRFCYNSGTPVGNGCFCTSQYEGRCCSLHRPSGLNIYQQGISNNVNVNQQSGSNNVNQQGNNVHQSTSLSTSTQLGIGLGVSFSVIFVIIIIVLIPLCCCK